MELLKILVLMYLGKCYSEDVLLSRIDTIPNILFENIYSFTTRPTGDIIIADGMAIWKVNIKTNPPTKHLIAGRERNSSNYTAPFLNPVDTELIDTTQLLMSDQANNCLRIVDLSTGETSPYAGVCEMRGFTDEYRLNATFYAPKGVVTLANTTYIADRGNNAIRVIQSDNVTTLYSGTPLASPGYLTACSDGALFVTVVGGVVRVNLSDVKAEMIADLNNNDGDQSAVAFDGTTGITHLSEFKIAVADYSNHRLRIIDLQTSMYDSFCPWSEAPDCKGFSPISVHSYGDSLLVGEGTIKQIPLDSVTDESSRKCHNTSVRTYWTTSITTTSITTPTTPTSETTTKKSTTPNSANSATSLTSSRMQQLIMIYIVPTTFIVVFS